jgi:epoxyqueuosine reductase
MLDTNVIKEYAYTLGFDMARVSSADSFPEAERIIK